MNNQNIEELTIDLPPIIFSGKSSVKELKVKAHITVDKSNRVVELLHEKVKEYAYKEYLANKDKKKDQT